MKGLMELYCIADTEKITVDSFDLEAREALSFTDDAGACYIAIDPFKLSSSADEKTKLAHELGHCMTGSFYNRYAAADIRQRHENRADKWAIKKLIPEDELEEAVACGYTEAWELAERFNVTEDFMKKAMCWYVHGTLAEDALGGADVVDDYEPPVGSYYPIPDPEMGTEQ